MIDIIPKVSQSPPLLVRIFFILSIGVFLVSVGGFVLLFFLELGIQQRIVEIEDTLGAEKTQEQTQLEQEVSVVRTRLEDFTTLVRQRKDVLPAFSFLETVVHPDVTFLAMSIDSVRHNMQLQGSAESFFALDEQLVVLQARSEPSSLSLTNLNIGIQSGVDFQIEIQFPAEFFQ
ncbi:hypothetical protein IIB97_00160 [Patescibacteria group bacterium]|nr:hypothetical protein [Patescibacteria group bacterium]